MSREGSGKWEGVRRVERDQESGEGSGEWEGVR